MSLFAVISQQFVKVSSMATTILALVTDHINFLEQSKQAQAAEEVKEVGRSYPDSNLDKVNWINLSFQRHCRFDCSWFL